MISVLKSISLNQLCEQKIMFDANIFMVGIDRRYSDARYSFERMKEIYLLPLFLTFKDIVIHRMVYMELDYDTKTFIDEFIGKNVTIVDEDDWYGKDPVYTDIFNDIANHERVQYERGRSKDRGEVYSLAYAAYKGINYFSSKEIMVDDISTDIKVLQNIHIVTFDIILLIARVYHSNRSDSSYNKALKSMYKEFCEDVIKRHHLPSTLNEYIAASIALQQ